MQSERKPFDVQREKPSNCAASTEKIYIRKDLRSPLIATPTFVAEKDGARSVPVNSLGGPGADVGGAGAPCGGLMAPPAGLGHRVGAAAVTALDGPSGGGLRRGPGWGQSFLSQGLRLRAVVQASFMQENGCSVSQDRGSCSRDKRRETQVWSGQHHGSVTRCF